MLLTPVGIAESTEPQIVAFVSDYWTSVAQLREQLNIIQTAYPVGIEIMSQDRTVDDPYVATLRTSAALAAIPSFKAAVKTVDRAVGSKVMIDFFFDFTVFAHWPMALKGTRCEVEVLMGPFECVFYLLHQGAHPDVRPPVRRTSVYV